MSGLLRLSRLLLRLPPERRKVAWAELKPLIRGRWLREPVNRGAANPAPPALFQIASSFWLSQAVYVAAKLRIADLLADGAQSVRRLAQATGSHPDSLLRLMRTLAGVGIFSQPDAHHFAVSALGQGLRTGVPGSLQSAVLTLGEIHYPACGELLHSIQTGEPAFAKAFGADLFGYLTIHESAAISFNRGMGELSAMLAYAVLGAYNLSSVSTIIDVGGGEGRLLNKLLEFYPAIEGTAFDLPSVVEKAAGHIEEGARCLHAGGNFFDSVPAGADLYLLCGVIHDWSDACALQILRNCRRASAPDAKLLLVEMVVPLSGPDFSQIIDLNMLAMNGGRERTKVEFASLLNAAGYKISRVIPTLAPQSLIEAVPE